MYPAEAKFLVVDDFLMVRDMVKKALNGKGLSNIITAKNGQEALAVLNEYHNKKEPIDLIISDWNMPVMTGIDLLKNCKLDKNLKNIPFLMVTAERDQAQIMEAAKLGVSDYIIKPFSSTTLLEKIEKIYQKKMKTEKGI